MMRTHMQFIFRVIALSFFLGAFSSQNYAQEWGVVEKSTLTERINDQVFYLHTVVKGNTFYSLAKVYELSVAEIKAANPDLGDELKLGSIILIPMATNDKDEASIEAPISYDNYFFHVVKQGESLYSIAKIFGVKVDDIVAINKLISPDISPGFHLKIPELDYKRVQKPEKKEPQQTKPQKLSYFEYTVQSKETLFSIAKRYGIGLETLKYINNLSSNTIQPGQIVRIPKVVLNRKPQERKDYIIHQVQAKEGLYGIARKYGVAIDQIKAINPGLTEAISIGQQIKIPRQPNEKGFIEHRVASKKEKLADIAREYEISVRNLKELNPDAPTKVRRGETVYIPVDFIDRTQEALPEPDEMLEEELPEEELYTNNLYREFNVALMLPLYLSDVDSLLDMERGEVLSKRDEIRAFRFLEFYEGAQIAVDSLRQLGMNLNFRVYDVNDDEIETALLLQDPVLRDMDLIISLLFSRSFTLVSNFSKEYRIPLVNVLSKRRQIVYENPYVFKISPKPNNLYKKVADFVGEHMSEYNTIIVRNNPYQLANEYNLISGLLQEQVKPEAYFTHAFALQKVDEYMEDRQDTYLDTLRYELEKNEYAFVLDTVINRPFDTTWVANPIKTVTYSVDSLTGIMEQASLFRDNLIVALGSDEVFAIELFTKLNFVRDSLNIKVIGLPDWHNYMNLDVDYSQPFSLRVVSENFVDYNAPDVIRFVDKFQNQYHKVPEVERYSFLGYDATFYFLQALFRFGDDMLEKIPDFQTPLLQNQLQFEKQNNGGYENLYWNLYRQENYGYKLEK